MMAGIGSAGSVFVGGVAGWLATYAVHSAILLGGAALVTRRLVRADAWREVIWKTALLGGLATATLQAGLDFRPLSGEWRFPVGRVRVAGAAPAAADRTARGVEDGAPAAAPQASPGVRSDAGRNTAGRTDLRGTGSVAQAGARRQAGIGTAPSTVQTGGNTRARDGGEGMTSGRATSPWLMALLALWSAGAVLFLARLARHHLRLLRLLRDRAQVTDGAILSLLATLRRNAGVWRPVRLTVAATCPTPLALGTREICVPEPFLSRLDRDQQRSTLAHELAHLARRDPAWHLTAGIIEAIFFFQPLNRLARRRLREAAENLCDDWAVQQTGSALGLARSLAEVASWVVPGAEPVPSGTMAMAEGGSPLLRRVERLLAEREGAAPRGVRRAAAAAVGLLAVVAVVAPGVSATGGGSEPSRAAPVGPDSRPLANASASAQDPVIRHPAPEEPLERRWGWAEAEAQRRGDSAYWVAYAFERALSPDRLYVEDSEGWSTEETADAPLGRLVFGPSYERPVKASGPVRQPVLVLFRVAAAGSDGPRVDRVSVRAASLGMSLSGLPLYWLGMAEESESFDWLRRWVDDLGDERLRGTVIEAIAMHEDAGRVVPFLADVVRSERPDGVREEAVEGLAWHATEGSVALLRATALEDRSVRIREEAAETLGELGTPEASAALTEVVRSRTPEEVRVEAVEAMAGWSAPEVLETLVRLAFEDPNAEIQEEAIETIAEFPAASAVPALERIAHEHPSIGIRREAVEQLGELDPAAAAEVIEALLREDTPAELREEAIDALAERASPRALEAIVAVAMSDPSPELQEEAVEKLAEFAPADALPHLEQIIWEHPSASVRREAVETLAEFPAQLALPILDEVVARSTEGALLEEAVQAIAEFPADLSVPRLLKIVREHPRAEARREALDQLGDRIG